jgi:hypothetical protein
MPRLLLLQTRGTHGFGSDADQTPRLIPTDPLLCWRGQSRSAPASLVCRKAGLLRAPAEEHPRLTDGMVLGAGVRLEPDHRLLDRHLVVSAKQWPEHRCEGPQERAVGVHPPVEAHVNLAVGGAHRPHAVSAQVAIDLHFELARGVEPNDR